MERHARLEHSRIAGAQRQEASFCPVWREADADRVGGAMIEIVAEARLLEHRAARGIDLARGDAGTDRLDRAVEGLDDEVGKRRCSAVAVPAMQVRAMIA